MELTTLKRIGDLSTDAVFLYQLTAGRFTYLNQAVSRIWERPVNWFNQDLGQLIASVHSEDLPKAQQLFQKVQQVPGFGQAEVRILVPGGGEKHLNCKIFAESDNQEGAFLMGFIEDITAQKNHETYLLEFGNKKNTILEILAHDLTGPLNMAKTLASTLEKQDQPLPSYSVEYARIIQEVCTQSINLISDLLSEEHTKSPQVLVKTELVNISELSRLVLRPYQVSNSSLQPQIEFATNTKKAFSVIDKVKFSQVLNNIISNALKFTPSSGLIILKVTDTGRDILISVADNGIGIPAQLQPFLFMNHTKASRPGLHGEKSRGIGMFISKTLVEMQGGKIWFESQENVGTTFYVLFPKAQ